MAVACSKRALRSSSSSSRAKRLRRLCAPVSASVCESRTIFWCSRAFATARAACAAIASRSRASPGPSAPFAGRSAIAPAPSSPRAIGTSIQPARAFPGASRVPIASSEPYAARTTRSPVASSTSSTCSSGAPRALPTCAAVAPAELVEVERGAERTSQLEQERELAHASLELGLEHELALHRRDGRGVLDAADVEVRDGRERLVVGARHLPDLVLPVHRDAVEEVALPRAAHASGEKAEAPVHDEAHRDEVRRRERRREHDEG